MPANGRWGLTGRLKS